MIGSAHRRVFALAVFAVVALTSASGWAAPAAPIAVAVLRDWPPEYSTDEAGKPTGFAVDVMDAVARRAGLSVSYRVYDTFPDAIAALEQGQVRAIPNFGITTERDARFDFTEPVETFAVSLFVRTDSHGIRSLEDLDGREVAVVRSNIGVSVVADHAGARARVYPDVRAAFYDLLAGRVDGLVYPDPVMREVAQRAGLEHRVRVVGAPLAEVKRAIAVRAGDSALLTKLNAAVVELSHSGEYKEIYERWYAKEPPFWSVSRVLWTSGGVVLLLLVAFGVWRARTSIALSREETERLRAQAMQAQTEIRYRTVMENASDGVFVVDMKGRFIDVNQRACEMLGYQREELLELGIADIVSPEDAQRSPLKLGADFAGRAMIIERMLVCKDGSTVPVEVSAGPVDDSTIVGIVRDVSERKRAEAVLREQELQLRQAQKMEAVGRLAGGVAHDFNNLLTAINGYAELLTRALPAGSSAAEDVGQIREAAQRGAALSRQLLTFSRREVREPEILSVDSVVGGLQKMLGRLLGEDVSLEVSLAALARVEVDRGQLEQVVMNLVVNARDAEPKGGRIAVRTSDVELAEPRTTRTGDLPQGRYVLLEVEDDGIGMSEALQTKIFDPFFTTKPEHEGTGLGLSTVLGIVVQAGGAVDVDSTEGQGTTFRVYLPVAEEDPEVASPLKKSSLAPEKAAGRSVLVVEDEPAVRRVLVRMLKQHGFQVTAAENGDAALSAVKAGMKLDLLLTDVVMPGSSGVELVERVLVVHPELAVIYMSGYANHHLADEHLQRSRSAFLQKPFSAKSLLEAIDRVSAEA